MNYNILIPWSEFKTKTEAELRYNANKEHFGGKWSLFKRGRRWVVEHTMTRNQERRASAEATLKNSYWTSPYYSPYNTKEAQKRIDTFTARLAVDPLDAFEWRALDAITASAETHVLKLMVKMHGAGDDDETICRAIEDEADRMVRYESLNRSTNPINNLTEQAKRIAMNKFARELRSFINHYNAAIGELYALSEEEG